MEKSEIKHEWIYQQPPAEVWEYLTRSELIALWLMPNNFKPVRGHEFQLQAKPMPELKLDGKIQCKVLEIEPLEKLSYSWKGGPGDGSIILDTIVEWKLEPHGKGTRLLLKQTGFKENNMTIFNDMTAGWKRLIERMLAQINRR